MTSNLTNVRYGYFDALRGFTMILVVFSHITLLSIGIEAPINLFFCSFRMPLFFFVSGFFAYKALDKWTPSRIKDIVIRKFKVQIVGALTFILLFTIFTRHRLPSLPFNSEGYWFTFVLFRLFLLYIITVMIARKLKSERMFWITMSVLSVICACCHFLYSHYEPVIPIDIKNTISQIITFRLFYYFPYFTLGIAARSQLGNFEKLLSNDNIKVIVAGLIIALWSAVWLGVLPPVSITISVGFNMPLAYPLGLLTILLLIQIFYSNRFRLDRENRFNRSLKFIGRRTLDIYFLHYFFLPDLSFMRPFLERYNSMSTQLVIGMTFTLIVVGLSLFAGQIIRMSPILSEWLLGVKRHRPEQNILAPQQ